MAAGVPGSLPKAKMALAAASRVLLHAGVWSGREIRCTAPEQAGWVSGRRWLRRGSGELANGALGCPQDPASGAGRPWTAHGTLLTSGC